MARLVRSFIGGITARVTGGESYEVEPDPNPPPTTATRDSRDNRSPEGGKLLSSSDEEDGGLLDQPLPSICGTLSKWTNYLQGWQDRYVVVRTGILSYYKSEIDTRYGCRGSISLHRVKILVRERETHYVYLYIHVHVLNVLCILCSSPSFMSLMICGLTSEHTTVPTSSEPVLPRTSRHGSRSSRPTRLLLLYLSVHLWLL